ncbi:GNAT family N-acetyltransferase [Paenibacillus macerans]|uniref:GNAT family N-acetyltransferase n=1 Tax=Paenibacillus macerans TaxID=44252 RepID=UPI003D320193
MNIVHELPSAAEYLALKDAAGQAGMVEEAVKTALKNSLFAVTARGADGRLIGIGRVIGDGGCYYQVVDVNADPAFLDSGLDEAILKELLEYLDQHAPEGAAIMVVADVQGIPLYQKNGFKLMYPDYYGMVRA